MDLFVDKVEGTGGELALEIAAVEEDEGAGEEVWMPQPVPERRVVALASEAWFSLFLLGKFTGGGALTLANAFAHKMFYCQIKVCSDKTKNKVSLLTLTVLRFLAPRANMFGPPPARV